MILLIYLIRLTKNGFSKWIDVVTLVVTIVVTDVMRQSTWNWLSV